MKKLIVLMVLLTSFSILKAQESKPKIYDPLADAKKDLAKAVKQAKSENKHVFVQIGGNWCIWCLRFNELVTSNKSLDSLIHSNYVVVHINYSKENKNEAVLEKLDKPQRFGFPVFVILDKEGKRIHTQNSAYLEGGGHGHDPVKVADFLNSWSPVKK